MGHSGRPAGWLAGWHRDRHHPLPAARMPACVTSAQHKSACASEAGRGARHGMPAVVVPATRAPKYTNNMKLGVTSAARGWSRTISSKRYRYCSLVAKIAVHRLVPCPVPQMLTCPLTRPAHERPVDRSRQRNNGCGWRHTNTRTHPGCSCCQHISRHVIPVTVRF